MSELINTGNKQTNIRLGLLATASVVVLAACVAPAQEGRAADRPTVWVEAGWHLDSIAGSNETLVPPLDGLTTTGFPDTPSAANSLGQGAGGFPSFTDMENVLGRSSGAEGSISFQPRGSDWVFSVSARYGRTHSKRHVQQRHDIYGTPAYVTYLLSPIPKLKTPHFTNYVEQDTDNTEAHTIIDFQVGKDVGLGLFGANTESVFSFGARYVQMNMTSKGHSYAAPGARFYHGKTVFAGLKYAILTYNQNSATVLERYSNFSALGPSLSWKNTTGLWGEPADGQFALDWGMNAALLFGRQKVNIHHNSVANSYRGFTAGFGRVHYTTGDSNNRIESRRVTVPNLGGFAALSYRFINAKLSVGYRGDFFFGAMDRGLDTHRSVTTGYQGPFATISVGLGG
jgi:hypothetical protein